VSNSSPINELVIWMHAMGSRVYALANVHREWTLGNWANEEQIVFSQ